MNARARAIVSLVAVVALAALTAGCTTGSSAKPDTVSAVGVGVATAVPDRAVISFGVDARAKTGPAAMDSCTAATGRIVDALKKAGVEEKEIRTEQVSLYPIRDNTGRTVTSYQATQSIRVTTSKVDKTGELIAAATSAGASQVSGPSFSVTNENAARAGAIGAAMDDAKMRAEAMAKAAGRTLDSVVSATERATTTAQNPYPYGYDSVQYSHGMTAAKATPTLLGQQDVTTQITVVYRLK